MKIEVTQEGEYKVINFIYPSAETRKLKLSEESYKALENHFKPKAKRKDKQPASAPSIEEVKAYFVEKGYMETVAIKFHEYYSNGNPPWTDGKGNPVRSWKQKCAAVWFKDENKIKEQTKQQSSFFR
jgi:hypothetical protein